MTKKKTQPKPELGTLFIPGQVVEPLASVTKSGLRFNRAFVAKHHLGSYRALRIIVDAKVPALYLAPTSKPSSIAAKLSRKDKYGAAEVSAKGLFALLPKSADAYPGQYEADVVRHGNETYLKIDLSKRRSASKAVTKKRPNRKKK